MNYYNINQMEAVKKLKGAGMRAVHSENMTMAFWEFEPHTQLPEHTHPHEQITTILEGEFELRVAGQQRQLKAADLVVIPPHAVHSGRSLTHCRVVDVFHPVREDLR